MGLPTMFDLPGPTACLPKGSMPSELSIFITLRRGHGVNLGRPTTTAPTLDSWDPSTSFSGSSAARTAAGLICSGKAVGPRFHGRAGWR